MLVATKNWSRSGCFDVYWILLNKQTSRQAKYIIILLYILR